MALVVAAAAVVFVVNAAPWIGQGFGYSLDGFNGAVWGQGARAAVDDPIGNRLGGVQPDGHRYANHPPLTVWTAAVGSGLSGDSPIGVRLPAVAASVLALAVLALLLRDAGVSPPGVVVGAAVAGTSSMFLAYGAMLDTPVVSLPCGLAALAVAQRCWQGRPPRPAVLVAVAALAAVSGWQASLLAVLAAAVCALVDRRSALWVGAGVVLGTTVTAMWIAWVHGSLRPLFDQAGLRSGPTGQSVSWLTAQQRHLGDLYGPVLLVVVLLGTLAALWPRRDAQPTRSPSCGPRVAFVLAGTRPVVAVVAVDVVGYTVVFRNGSAVHDYWTFWGVALVGIAVAALVDRVVGLAGPRARSAGVTALACVVAVAVGALGLARDSVAEERIRTGLDALDVLDAAPDAADPTDVAIAAYRVPGTLPWADLAVDGHAVHADDVTALRALPPDLPVLVVGQAPPSEALRRRATAVSGTFVLVPAAALAEHLGG